MVGEFYGDKWRGKPYWEWTPPVYPSPYTIPGTGTGNIPVVIPQSPVNPKAPTQEEFDALKQEVLEMKELLKRAKKYDEDNGEPDCEMDDKIATLKKVADLVGVDLSEIFTK